MDKAERFIKILSGKWAYAMPFQTSEERTPLLPRYLGIDFGRRCHMTFCDISPQQWPHTLPRWGKPETEADGLLASVALLQISATTISMGDGHG